MSKPRPKSNIRGEGVKYHVNDLEPSEVEQVRPDRTFLSCSRVNAKSVGVNLRSNIFLSTSRFCP